MNLQGFKLKGKNHRTFRKEPEVFEVYYVEMDERWCKDNNTGDVLDMITKEACEAASTTSDPTTWVETNGYDLLVGRQIGGRACAWHAQRAERPPGGGETVIIPADRVSVG